VIAGTLRLARSPDTRRLKQLTVVDIDASIVESVKHQVSGWPPGCRRIITRILCLDGGNMSPEITDESFDIAFALGLSVVC
jgi:hypothetical protein